MYNNYGFNPYYQPQRFQTMEQPSQPQFVQSNMVSKPVGLLGKPVDSVSVVTAMDIPLDGSICYFPLTDNSAIVTKQLQADGTSKTIVYKPVDEEKEKMPKYITAEELEKAIKEIDFGDLDDLNDELKSIKKEMKEIKSKLKIKED